jgi:hypothetical protein
VTAAFLLTALNGLVTWYRTDGPIPATAIADMYADLALRAVLTLDGEGPGASG